MCELHLRVRSSGACAAEKFIFDSDAEVSRRTRKSQPCTFEAVTSFTLQGFVNRRRLWCRQTVLFTDSRHMDAILRDAYEINRPVCVGNRIVCRNFHYDFLSRKEGWEVIRKRITPTDH